ncbi:MAG: MotA/TolQ/ExbB proton channel family protein [Gammaproteobacteria bacterium]
MNQKPFRTLFLWVIWVAATLIVYVSLFQDTEVWEFLINDPSRITWLIVGLFLFGILSSFLLTIMITLESIDAFYMEDTIKVKGLMATQVRSARRVVGRFFNSLKSILQVNGRPDVEALLNVELAFYKRLSHSVEVIGNLLVTLGLIGTVAGLTLTLTGLTGSLEALGHDQEMLLSGLRKAMAGMGTAFYTTLLGAVLGGVLLRVFAQITENGVESLFDKLMRVCLVHCSADMVPSLERDLRFLDGEIEALGHHLNALQDAFKDSGVAITDFRREVNDLKEMTNDENESMNHRIRIHQTYSQILKEETQLLNKTKGSWIERIIRSVKGTRS